MRRTLHGPVWFMVALPLLFWGCGQPSVEPLPEPLRTAHSWGEVAFGGVTGEVYADLTAPGINYTHIWLYFPRTTPADPSVSRLDLTLRLEDAAEPFPGNPQPDSGLIPSAPVTSPMPFDSRNYIASGIVVPYMAGEWSLEFRWQGADVDSRAYLPLTIDDGATSRAVTPVGSFAHLVILAWVEPPKPVAGPQVFRLTAWRAFENAQRFQIDTTLTVLLSAVDPGNPDPPADTSRAAWDGSHYSGTITLPELNSWDIKASVLRDTALVGDGNLSFD